MPIPVYINVFNRLETTRRLADQCSVLPGAVVLIIDNNSTWEPLIDWYENECQFDVIRLAKNSGHHAPWSVIDPNGVFQRKWGQGKYVVTDCDLDIGGCPADLLSVLEIPFSWEVGVKKSGTSLAINDLPEWQSGVVEWESQFWKRKFQEDGRFYEAPIDTTFAMYERATQNHVAMSTTRVKCARSSSPYTARHTPWYLDGKNLDEENANYFKTSNSSNSWRPSPHGKGLGH